MEKVLHEANFQEIDELYGLYIDSSGCPGIPKNVRFWKGLIVVQRRGENEKLTDVSYLADTQRIEQTNRPGMENWGLFGLGHH